MSATPPVVNHDVLEELSAFCDQETLDRLISMFLAHVPELLKSAREALANDDRQSLARAMHSMRSGIGSLGAERMAPIAAAIERNAPQQAPAELNAQMDQLADEFAAYRHSVTAWRARQETL